MSTKKFSELPTLSGASVVAADDYLPINDASVADASKNKRITVAELAAALNSSIVHNTLSGLTTGDPHTQYAVIAPGSSSRNVFQTTSTGHRTLAIQALASQTAALLQVLRSDGTTVDGHCIVGASESAVTRARWFWRLSGGAADQGGGANIQNAAWGISTDPVNGGNGFHAYSAGGFVGGPLMIGWCFSAQYGLRAGFDHSYGTQNPWASTWEDAAFIARPRSDARRAADFIGYSATQSGDILRVANYDLSTIYQRFDKTGYWVNKKTSAIADGDLSASELTTFLDATNGAAAVVHKIKEAGGTVRVSHVRMSRPFSITSGQEAGGTNECICTFTAKDWAGNTCPQTIPCLVWINSDPPDSWSVTGALDLNKFGSVDSVQGPLYGEFSAGVLVVAVTQSLGTVGTVHVLCLDGGLKSSISPSSFGA